jgi:acetolactate synthase I/II/III large subunit
MAAWRAMSEQPRPTGGDTLVALMTELGVETAFGVVSVHNQPLVDAVDAHLRFVPVRHEQGAVNAADGYARARQHLGVAITSTGTGAGNAAGALIESLSAGTAVLHVTGQIDSRYLGQGRGVIHETQDQTGLLRAVSKSAHTVMDPAEAGRALRVAAESALAEPRGPSSVEWPINLQYWHSDIGLPGEGTPDSRIDGQAIARAAELIAAARRPLVWAGGGATTARAQVDLLLRRTGAGLLTSNAGRGTIPEDDPRCVGNFASAKGCEPLLLEADLLISIGTHFRSNETRDYQLPLPKPHIQIDIDPAALGRVHPADVGLAGDASTVLDELLMALDPSYGSNGDWAERIREVRAEVREAMAAAIGPQATVCEALRAVLPRDAVVARDITIPSSTWGNRLLEIYEPWTNIYPRGGGIGQGLGLGIGAAIARPEAPTAVIAGDGGLVAQLGELATVAQEQPWTALIVFNDEGYGVLRNMQDRHVGRRAGVDLATPSFEALGTAFDLPYARVTDADRFGPTLEGLLEQGGPCLVEVDVLAIGEMPQPFIPPVEGPPQD